MAKENSNKTPQNILSYFEKNGLMELIKAITEKDDLKELNKSVGAIDIGYGNTKYTSGVDDNGDLNIGIFPSITPVAPTQALHSGLLGQRDTKIIDIDGFKYEVGPDAELTANNTETTRNLNENYIFSEQYQALFYGALLYMEKSHYDILVLGLPINFLYNDKKLIEKFTGKHIVNGQEFTVDKIIVVPQPLGGFYDIAIHKEKYFDFINETNLIIDPGFLTFDFLVTHGLKPIENRSGALSGGMSRVLNTLAKSISTEIEKPYSDYSAIDRAIRNPKKVKNEETGKYETKRVLKVAGKEIDLLPHIAKSSPTIQNSIGHMRNTVQSYDDIDNIALVGGSENVFEKKIREDLQRDILKTENAIFSNVRGFWYIGVLELIKSL